MIADLPAIRLGVRIALEGAVEICAEAGDTEHAIRAAHREQPEICLIGLDLPGDGIVAIRGICGVAPGTAAIALAPSQGADDLLACVHAGAIGYLPSSIDAASLRQVVAAVRDGEAAVPPALVLPLVREKAVVPERGYAAQCHAISHLARPLSTPATLREPGHAAVPSPSR